jgi:hypothetical protein
VSTDPTDPEAALATALAAFQAEMPHVGKGNSANAGTYTYSYADLADITKSVMPVMAKHGLSFSAKPTLNEDGKFVLEYVLRHAQGGRDVGQYPLPTSGTPQQVGSAISYARRYCFSAVTGVAPDEDDDGRAAADVSTDYSRPPRQRAQPAGPTVADARGQLGAAMTDNGWDRDIVSRLYADKAGHSLAEATDPALIVKFREHLFTLPQSALMAPAAASNGAVQ